MRQEENVKIIVGLGNPGGSYRWHRHNVGFQVVDVLGERHGIEVKKRSRGALIGSGGIGREAVILAKPQTFMNVSGDAVGPLIRYYKLAAEDLIVVHDDLDIVLGNLKLAFAAGHGGHNGVKSIIDEIGSGDFYRCRVGIGRPPAGMNAADYVLMNFSEDEGEAARKSVETAADAVRLLIEKGLAAAQRRYH